MPWTKLNSSDQAQAWFKIGLIHLELMALMADWQVDKAQMNFEIIKLLYRLIFSCQSLLLSIS